MRAFTITNTAAYPARVAIVQGSPDNRARLFGHVAVAAHGGVAIVQTNDVVTAKAFITMEDGNTISSDRVSLPAGGQRLTAQMLATGETFLLHLMAGDDAPQDQILLTNTCRHPVKFHLIVEPHSLPLRPILTSEVDVQPDDAIAVSTEQSYTFHGAVNGMTTAAVSTTPAQMEQDLKITVFQDGSIGDWDAYALRIE